MRFEKGERGMVCLYADASRASFECHRRSSTLLLSPSLIIDGLARRSFSYSKLYQEPMRLTIVKLDGSSFEIEVRNGATIGELKLAIEDYFFNHMPGCGPGKVSWPHVWGQFCFACDGRKLLKERHSLRDFGVKDGDQLHFVRHASNASSMAKERSQKKTSSSSSDGRIIMRETPNDDVQNSLDHKLDNEDMNQNQDSENGPTSYFRMTKPAEKNSIGNVANSSSSKCSGSLCHKFRKILRLYKIKL